jgi:hypothetical protein
VRYTEIPHRRKDGHTDVNHTVAFRNFGKGPKDLRTTNLTVTAFVTESMEASLHEPRINIQINTYAKK